MTCRNQRYTDILPGGVEIHCTLLGEKIGRSEKGRHGRDHYDKYGVRVGSTHEANRFKVHLDKFGGTISRTLVDKTDATHFNFRNEDRGE